MTDIEKITEDVSSDKIRAIRRGGIAAKIMVIGYSGSGKSTLAGALGKLYDVPVLHLDSVHFLPGWREREDGEKRRIVAEFIRENSGWVIDGNYRRLLYDERTEQADMIVELLFNRFVCLSRVWKRYREFKGKTRPDMGEGCPEKLDREFIKWVLKDGRTKSKKRHYKEVRERYPDKTVVLKSQRDIDRFLRGLKTGQ